MSDPRRTVPRTDVVLGDEELREATARLGRDRVKAEVVVVLAAVRAGEVAAADAARVTAHRLTAIGPGAMTAVLNGTGVVVHTNLGRAPLTASAVQAVAAAAGYVDVEFDLTSGRRAPRGQQLLAALRRAVPAAQDGFAVNNGAAALVLATTALAAGREIVVSRGEMVEIGDGFRLPNLIESTGARLREVGTTNRVTLADYAAAIGPDTGAVLKVHPSNFRIDGFTAAVQIRELATLPVPVIADVGSGLLEPDAVLPAEPDVLGALTDGAAVVTCSADKLLGGPQAGLVLGRGAEVQRLRRHPLARALRIDKLTVAALAATLYSDPRQRPVWKALHADPAVLRTRCDALAGALTGVVPATVVAAVGAVGGGGAPGVRLPGWAVALPAELGPLLRTGVPAVVTRTHEGRCLLDLRCIAPESDQGVLAAVTSAALAANVGSRRAAVGAQLKPAG